MLENIQYYEPTRFMGVTRIFEKIEEGIRGREAELTGLKRAVFNWAQRQALHHHKQEESGNPHSSIGYNLAKKLVLDKVTPILFPFECIFPLRFTNLLGSPRLLRTGL